MEKKIIAYIVFAFLLLLVAIIGLKSALTPLTLAWVLSYLCMPLLSLLERFSINRVVATTIILIIILCAMLSIVFIFIPYLLVELQYFIKDFPQTVLDVLQILITKAEEFGFMIDFDNFSLVNFIQSNLPNISASSVLWVGGAVKSALGNIISTVIGIISLFLFPVFFFYVSLNYYKIAESIGVWLPKRYRSLTEKIRGYCNEVLSGFVRGQLLIAAILACYYSILLPFVGLKFGVAIGFITGLLSIIPYVGFSIGFFSSLLVAFASGSGLYVHVAVVLTFLFAYFMDGFFLTPFLVGGSVGLSSLSIMLLLIIGGNLAGIWGMIVAIPFGAVLKRIAFDIKQSYTSSKWYKSN